MPGDGNLALLLGRLKCEWQVSWRMVLVDRISIRREERIDPIVSGFRDGATAQCVCCWYSYVDLPVCVQYLPTEELVLSAWVVSDRAR